MSESIQSRGCWLFVVIYDQLFTSFPNSRRYQTESSATLAGQKLPSHILAKRGWDGGWVRTIKSSVRIDFSIVKSTHTDADTHTTRLEPCTYWSPTANNRFICRQGFATIIIYWPGQRTAVLSRFVPFTLCWIPTANVNVKSLPCLSCGFFFFFTYLSFCWNKQVLKLLFALAEVFHSVRSVSFGSLRSNGGEIYHNEIIKITFATSTPASQAGLYVIQNT